MVIQTIEIIISRLMWLIGGQWKMYVVQENKRYINIGISNGVIFHGGLPFIIASPWRTTVNAHNLHLITKRVNWQGLVILWIIPDLF